MADVNLSRQRESWLAVFALDIISSAVSLMILGLTSKPTIQRVKARRFSTHNSQSGGKEPLKTTLGTYLFLWPAVLCYFLAYTLRFTTDILQTSGTIDYDGYLTWNGRTSYMVAGSDNAATISALTFATALLTIFFTVLLNGGVWIHSSHLQSNGTGSQSPNTLSKLWNTSIMLAMLGTGVAAWGYGISVRVTTRGSYGSIPMLTWSNVLNNDRVTRIIWTSHEAVVVAASLSVAGQVWREFGTVNKHARESSERNALMRFAIVVVPLILLRDVFIIYDVVLLYVPTAAWSSSSKLATEFLLVFCRQYANLGILTMILVGAWRMGRTVSIFSRTS